MVQSQPVSKSEFYTFNKLKAGGVLYVIIENFGERILNKALPEVLTKPNPEFLNNSSDGLSLRIKQEVFFTINSYWNPEETKKDEEVVFSEASNEIVFESNTDFFYYKLCHFLKESRIDGFERPINFSDAEKRSFKHLLNDFLIYRLGLHGENSNPSFFAHSWRSSPLGNLKDQLINIGKNRI